MSERFHDIPEHIRDSFERVYDQYDHLIDDLQLTEEYFMLLAAHNIMPSSSMGNDWYEEFGIPDSFDSYSYLERRAEYIEEKSNMEKHPFDWDAITERIDLGSLMTLDSIEDNMGSWYWYNLLAEEEMRIRRFIWPDRYPKPEPEPEAKEKPSTITIVPTPTEPVRVVRSDVSELFDSKDNLFDWIKEQGNSEKLTEILEEWRAKKPKLAPNRKRNQVIITNIIKGVAERHIYILAQRIGAVVDIYFPINKVTGKQEYAFIEFKSPESVQLAIEHLHGAPLGRQKIFVDIPKQK
jgi:hypothetical protein